MKLIFTFLISQTIVLAAANAKPSSTRMDVTLPPGKAHEVCAKIKSGDSVRWNFRSDTPVDFNLHHHIEKDVLMPIKKQAIASDEGAYKVDRTNDWCLMWTAGKEHKSKIEGDWSIEKANRNSGKRKPKF